MKRRTVSMSAETFVRFQEHCRATKQPMARVIEQLVRVYLAKNERLNLIVQTARGE
jgi:hypothetical protein